MKFATTRVIDNFCDDTTIFVAPILEAPRLDTFRNIGARMRMPAKRKRLVE